MFSLWVSISHSLVLEYWFLVFSMAVPRNRAHPLFKQKLEMRRNIGLPARPPPQLEEFPARHDNHVVFFFSCFWILIRAVTTVSNFVPSLQFPSPLLKPGEASWCAANHCPLEHNALRSLAWCASFSELSHNRPDHHRARWDCCLARGF